MLSFEQALSHSWLLAFATAFLSGLATSFTPCVYPMIPITVSLFGARQVRNRRTAFLLATMYVFGIASMYALLGVLAALAGWAIGGILASPWFIIPLAGLFVLLATSMFGLWDIRLPAALQNRIALIGGRGFRGAYAMGLVGGLLIAPCTGPWLAALLGYVATTRNVFFGGSLLFVYALGIGVLFWLIATFAVALPKSGPWMESVKSALGIALLVATLYYLQTVFSRLADYASASSTFLAGNLALVIAGIIVGGIHLSFHDHRLTTRIRKTVGILCVTLGAFGTVNFFLTPSATLPWVHEEAVALKTARTQNKAVLVDFSAAWCLPCKEMEKNIFTAPAVRRELQRFVLLKIDVTNDTEKDRALQTKYNAPLLPQVIVLDRSGKEVARTGKVDTPEQFLAILRGVQ